MLKFVLFILFSLSVAKDIDSSDDSSEYLLDLDVDEFYDLLETRKNQLILTRFYLPE